MKILHLTLKKRWFDLIITGKKKIEYREDKLYWRKRIFNNELPKNFDIIRFKNGYGDVPMFDIEFLGIFLVDSLSHIPINGEILEGKIIAIKLGKILNIKIGDL